MTNKAAIYNLKQDCAKMNIECDCKGNGCEDCYIKKAIDALKDIDDCRNELCLKCGNYKQSHLGYCYGCRWER